MISAPGSMNRRISHGQAIRSVLGRARVIHFITGSSGLVGRWRGGIVDGESGQVEVATGHLVAGDRPVRDRLVDLAGGERVAVRGGDPRVENLMAGPYRDDDGVAARAGRFADELGQDAMLLADRTARVDPGQVPVPPLRRNDDGAQADDHGGSTGGVVTAAPSAAAGRSRPGECRGSRRAHPHSAMSYPALTAPATTSGAPTASCCTAPATSGPS